MAYWKAPSMLLAQHRRLVPSISKYKTRQHLPSRVCSHHNNSSVIPISHTHTSYPSVISISQTHPIIYRQTSPSKLVSPPLIQTTEMTPNLRATPPPTRTPPGTTGQSDFARYACGQCGLVYECPRRTYAVKVARRFFEDALWLDFKAHSAEALA